MAPWARTPVNWTNVRRRRRFAPLREPAALPADLPGKTGPAPAEEVVRIERQRTAATGSGARPVPRRTEIADPPAGTPRLITRPGVVIAHGRTARAGPRVAARPARRRG
ncbi:hypothetical protein ACH4JS_10725 [Streptomyces sp. NPDC017638]|uniref:hypothetical protein n=1 Tax=Streptomyces sp. NPDC017638 TaxID=3365004 RepID=UPI0037A30FCF